MHVTQAINPLLLIVDDQDGRVRSLENILRPKGHVVLKASSGNQALDLTTKVCPDAVLIAHELPDLRGIDLVRKLRRNALADGMTPVILTAPETLSKAERLDALSAGAWDILEQPFDAAELVLKLDTFVRAKHEHDRIREQGLTDPDTGFYNVRGVLKRAKELSADSGRAGRSLTCVAFGRQSSGASQGHEDAPFDVEFTERLSAALRAVTRASDTVGCLSDGEFVVVAPGTNSDEAARLADRILEELTARWTGPDGARDLSDGVRAGFYSVPSPGETSAEDMLLKATMALRRAQENDGSFRVRSFHA